MGLGKLLFVLGLLGLGYWGYRSFRQRLAEKRTLSKSDYVRFALWGMGAVLILAVITGRAPALFALVGAALPMLTRVGRSAWSHWPLLAKLYAQWQGEPLGGADQGHRQFSETLVLTRSGQGLDGVVRQGPLAGSQLSQLSAAQIETLSQYCQACDPQALQLLQLFLAQQHTAGQSHGGRSSRARHGAMSEEEALAILGLKIPYTRDQVIQAHKRLMGKVHPDKGGSDYLASQLNRAKATLTV